MFASGGRVIEFCSHGLLLFCGTHCFFGLDVAQFYATQEMKVLAPVVDLALFSGSLGMKFLAKARNVIASWRIKPALGMLLTGRGGFWAWVLRLGLSHWAGF